MSDRLEIYTVYDHPKDYPYHFVVRKYTISRFSSVPIPDETPFLISRKLRVIEVYMIEVMGLYFCPRSHGDDPVIIGSYI